MVLSMMIIGVSNASAAPLTKELQFGMNGSDVSSAQTFLSQDQALYPQGLVTGYFGSFTKQAVINFQLRNEIPSVGRIGPMTLPIMNLQMATGMYPGMSGYANGTAYNTNTGATAPIIGNLGVSTAHNGAVVSWNTNVPATGQVYYSTNELNVSEGLNSVGVIGAQVAATDSQLRTTQSVSITGLSPNTRYYYMVYSVDQSGNVSVSWPSNFTTTF